MSRHRQVTTFFYNYILLILWYCDCENITSFKYKIELLKNIFIFSIFLYIFLSVLTDQQSQVQATNRVLIHVMCVLLGIFGFLFCNLDGKCVPFYSLSHLSKVAKSYQIN